MKKHRMLPLGLAGLIAVVLTAVGFVASGTAAPQATFKAGLVSDVGRFNDKGFNQNQLTGMKKAAKAPEDPVPGGRVAGRRATTCRTWPRWREVATTSSSRRASCCRMRPRTWRISSRTRSSRSPIKGSKPFKRKHTNVEGLTYATQENSYLIGCLAAKVAKQGREQEHQRRRRHQDPAGRHVPRRLQGRRAEVRPGHDGRDRLLAGLHRSGEVQEQSRRTRSTGARRSSSPSPVRAASARWTRPRRPASGASASTSTSRTSATHPHERREEGGHRDLPRRQGSEERQGLQGRRQPRLQPEERGRRRSARSARRPRFRRPG